MLVGAFGSFEWAIGQGYSDAVARTVSVNVFVVVELFYLFNCRSLTQSMFQLGLVSNPWIGLGAASMVMLQLAFTYAPFMNHIFHRRSHWLGRVVAYSFNWLRDVHDRRI